VDGRSGGVVRLAVAAVAVFGLVLDDGCSYGPKDSGFEHTAMDAATRRE